MLTLKLILTAACLLKGGYAGVVHCSPDSSKLTIRLDRRARLENFIVPEIDKDRRTDLMSVSHSGSGECNWQLGIYGDKSGQIVVEGISSDFLNDDRPQMPAKANHLATDTAAAQVACRILRGNSTCPEATNITIGSFNVISLPSGGHLSLTTSHAIENSTIAVKIVLIDEGYCARDMVSYENNCHHLTAQSTSLTESQSVIKLAGTADMKLASFDSLDDIRRFVSANQVPIGVFPTKTPLELNKPVRIGLFRSSRTGQVGHLSKTPGKCGIEVVENATGILPTQELIRGECGTLKITGSGLPAIEFVNCEQPMRALISFPETPRGGGCAHCSSRMIRDWLRGSQMSANLIPWYRRMQIVAPVVTAVAIAAIILVVAIGIACKKQKRIAHVRLGGSHGHANPETGPCASPLIKTPADTGQ